MACEDAPMPKGRDLRLVVAARFISFVGSAIAPIATAFAVIQLTGSRSALGLVLACELGAALAMILVGGVLADRFPRKRVLIASDVLAGTAQLAIAVLMLTGNAEVWHLALIGAVGGAAAGLFWPAFQGIIPELATDEQLQNANAVIALASNTARIGGAALGGLLVAATNPGIALLIDGLTFYASGLLVMGLRPVSVPKSGSNMVRALAEGWREFTSRRWLWVIVAQFSLLMAAQSAGFRVLGPIIAEEHLGGARAWGFIAAGEGVGLVAGALVAARIRTKRPLLAATFATYCHILPLALLIGPSPVVFIVAAVFANGIGMAVFNVFWNTAMQRRIPRDVLSRVSAYDALGSMILAPAGFLLAGPMASAFGTRGTLLICIIAMAVANTAALLEPQVRAREEPLHAEGTPAMIA